MSNHDCAATDAACNQKRNWAAIAERGCYGAGCYGIDSRHLEAEITRDKVELLNWVMQLCGSGSTTGMIRKLVHNKLVDITGEGQKA